MSTEDDRATASRIADATAAAMQAEGLFPTKFVILAEVLGTEGDREFWTATGPDENLRLWDTLGLLNMAIMRENAALTREGEGE